eukprot:TRINITY_DN38197_c0_g1_i2.p1 TRINITY_DN38197_c0_g1~~TRINITY_DN38197_c0_g1_i2.p1  ORF type:complete len:455 (+),score=111.49 TRINITY_DN38197_c0_g1_i2:124-1488(+)
MGPAPGAALLLLAVSCGASGVPRGRRKRAGPAAQAPPGLAAARGMPHAERHSASHFAARKQQLLAAQRAAAHPTSGWRAGLRCNCTTAMRLGRFEEFDDGPEPPSDPGCRCSHEPALLRAGRHLELQGRALDLRRREDQLDPRLHYIQPAIMGGFNNQRQCVINAVLALHMLGPGVAAVLPPSTPIYYTVMERWPHDYLPPYDVRSDRWLPWGRRAGWPGNSRTGRFETVWDAQQWFAAVQAAGMRTAAGTPAGRRLRRLPTVANITGCARQHQDNEARCSEFNISEWAPLRATVAAWRQVLQREPPGAWAADALCYQVAPMVGSDADCARRWGRSLCDAAFSSMQPNIVATTAADMILRALSGRGAWAAVHFQEDWRCKDLRHHFFETLRRRHSGAAPLYIAGGGGAPWDVEAAFAEHGVRTVNKSSVLPELPERLPFEVVGQVDWLVAAQAP